MAITSPTTTTKYPFDAGAKPLTTIVPAELAQEPGWLRSRFMHWPYPRPGITACGRRSCPVCGPPRMPAVDDDPPW
jgi:hypothetical protein